jgi:hypothetical protein
MKIIPLLVASLVLAMIPTHLSAADKDSGTSPNEPKTILMIGNSLTYTWNIPAILEKFAADTQRTLKVTPHVAGGKDLAWHWVTATKENQPTAKDVLTKGGYDLVILQEYSNLLLKPEGRESFGQMLPQYLDLIRSGSMNVMLYMAHPTSKEVDLEGIRPIIDAYTTKADEFGLVCAPAALAFARSSEKFPQLALIDNQTDRKYAQNKVGTHQSPYGSYLAACTLYAAIYQQSPVGLTFHGAFDRGNPDPIPIEAADALGAQEIAWEVWQEYVKNRPVQAKNH